MNLNISEIFYSIQGEGTRAGLPCIFVRLQGCMLRCTWCDTPYALDIRKDEKILSLADIKSEIKKYDCNFVEFTGGEPLRQKDALIPLISDLLEIGKTIAIETNGHVDANDLDTKVIRIIDVKCPGSGMSKFNNYSNLEYARKSDEIKFVVKDRDDFDFAVGIINKYNLCTRTNAVLMSPVFGEIEYSNLAEWILESGLSIRMQLQIHKYIWEPDTRGV